MVTSPELDVFTSNVRLFVKLTGIGIQSQLERKWVRDEFDAVDYIERISILVKKTASMKGKKMYAKRPYDHIDDVRRDMYQMMLHSDDTVQSAVLRKKHLSMYYLLIDPILMHLQNCGDHQHCIDVVDDVISTARHIVLNHNIETNYEDALVAKAQVSQIISSREAERKAKPKRSRKPT